MANDLYTHARHMAWLCVHARRVQPFRVKRNAHNRTEVMRFKWKYMILDSKFSEITRIENHSKSCYRCWKSSQCRKHVIISAAYNSNTTNPCHFYLTHERQIRRYYVSKCWSQLNVLDVCGVYAVSKIPTEKVQQISFAMRSGCTLNTLFILRNCLSRSQSDTNCACVFFVFWSC